MATVEIFVLNHNGGRWIESTLATVAKQTCRDCKIILSDDGSTDGSVERLRRFEREGVEFRIRKPGTGGIFKHYNLCLREASAPYVAFYHQDDLYTPGIAAREMEFLEKNPGIAAVVTGGKAIDARGRALWPIALPAALARKNAQAGGSRVNRSFVLDAEEVLNWVVAKGNSFLVCPSAMFRTSVLKEIGGFSEEFPICADIEMWLRLLFGGHGLGYLDRPLIHYRFTAGQESGKDALGRTEGSEFFRLLDRQYVAKISDPEARATYEGLKHLDLLQAGLNRLAAKGDSSLAREQLNWFRRPENRKRVRRFGTVDRLKVIGARIIAPWMDQPLIGRQLARLVVLQTDVRSGATLRMLLKLKRDVFGVLGLGGFRVYGMRQREWFHRHRR